MVLISIIKFLEYDVIGCHINYNNREETKDEQKFLEDWCNFNDIKLYVKEIINIKRENSKRSDYELITKNLLNGLGFFDSNKRKDLFKFWLLYLGYNRKILPNLNPNFNLLPQSWWFHDELTNKSIQQTFLFEVEGGRWVRAGGGGGSYIVFLGCDGLYYVLCINGCLMLLFIVEYKCMCL